MSKRQSSPKNEYAFFDRIADAALIASLYTILPFSPLRYENFASDKHALIGIFTIIILATWLMKMVQGWRPDWSIARKHPLIVGVIAFMIATAISTVFSITPIMSWVGKTQYPNGLYSLIMYAILMLQTVDSIPRIRTFIAPMLVLLIIVQLVWSALIDPRTTAQWLFATAGNPNYLSSWLVMAIFVLAYELYSHWMNSKEEDSPKRSKRGRSFNQGFYYRLLIGAVIILAFVVMLLAGGRGALLALLAAAVGTITMLGILQRRFRLVFGAIGTALVLLLGFIFVSAFLPEVQSYLRVLRLGDASRYELWAGGVDTITSMNEPLVDYRGNADNLTMARPIIGYGPDMTIEFQSRWGRDGYFETRSRLSFHNHLLDSLTERGILGLVTSLMIFGSVIYYLFKELHWLSKKQLPLLLILMGIMAAIVSFILLYIAPDGGIKSVIAVSIGLSLPISIYLWGMIQEFLRFRAEPKKKNHDSEGNPVELTPQLIFLVFMANLVIAHWIDIQFAFGQPISEPLFWLVLGWIVYRTLPQSETETEPVISTSQTWLVNIVMIGLHLMHLRNNLYFSALQPTLADISLMLSSIFIVGGLGFWLSRESRENNDWLSVGMGLASWLILFFVGSAANSYIAPLLDSGGTPLSTDSLPLLYIVATFSSLVLCAFMLLVWFLPLPKQTTEMPRIGIVALIVACAIGFTIYDMDYMGAATARHVWEFANDSNVEEYENIVEISDKMRGYILWEKDTLVPLIYSHINYAILTRATTTESNLPELNATWNALLDIEPYFNHTQLGWRFIETYEAVFAESPPAE